VAFDIYNSLLNTDEASVMEAPDLERRLAAIVAADVEGYSSLMHSDEESTMATLSARRAVIDLLIAEHRGRIANTAGDSVLAEFASVLEAISCAVAIQEAMVRANDDDDARPMHLRIGINVGDVMVKEGDIFGDGVNVAARLESLAPADGICVSRGVRDHLRHRANFVFEDLGEQLVKNIAHPIRAYRLRMGCREVTPERSPETEADLPPLPDPELSAESEVSLELALWESVKDGSLEELGAYLEHYPEGTFASLARTRQSAAEGESTEAPTIAALAKEASENALDAAFWDAIKDTQAPDELAAYLEQHPDGHFSALARARLARPAETANHDETPVAASPSEAVELTFWESVRDTEDPHLLAAYLEKFPEGEFAVIAQAWLESLQKSY
jgi:adenylate cyclase